MPRCEKRVASGHLSNLFCFAPGGQSVETVCYCIPGQNVRKTVLLQSKKALHLPHSLFGGSLILTRDLGRCDWIKQGQLTEHVLQNRYVNAKGAKVKISPGQGLQNRETGVGGAYRAREAR